jgi:hypothetical protein
MSRNDVILGVFAAALVIFSLVVALVVPKRNPGFPGRRLGFFIVLCALFIVAMLAAVEVLGESHDFGAAHGETAAETGGSPTATETTGGGETGATETGGGGGEPQGNAQAGEEVFTSVANPACGRSARTSTMGWPTRTRPSSASRSSTPTRRSPRGTPTT